MGWAPAVFGRFLKPGGRGGRPKLEFAFPTMPAWIWVTGVERGPETRGATGREGEGAVVELELLRRRELGLLAHALARELAVQGVHELVVLRLGKPCDTREQRSAPAKRVRK